jgi:hypothetical protein
VLQVHNGGELRPGALHGDRGASSGLYHPDEIHVCLRPGHKSGAKRRLRDYRFGLPLLLLEYSKTFNVQCTTTMNH